MTHRVLVTGGTGFIGTHLVKRLVSLGDDVRVLSRNIPAEYNCVDGSDYMLGDFLQPDHIAPALDGVHILYHLAVTTMPGWSNDQILYDAQTNLMGSLRLIQSAVEAGVRKFVFVSSGGSVYGSTPRRPVREDAPNTPISAHGISKLAVEKYLEIYRRKSDMDYCVARAGNPYGEGQDPDRGQGFIAYALGQIKRKKEIVIWGDGTVVRDFFYVGDLVEALVSMRSASTPHQIYNVGSGEGKSLREILELLKTVTGQDVSVRYEAGRTADVPYNCLDVSRIREDLGWQPQTSLASGLARTWSWIQAYVNKPATQSTDLVRTALVTS